MKFMFDLSKTLTYESSLFMPEIAHKCVVTVKKNISGLILCDKLFINLLELSKVKKI